MPAQDERGRGRGFRWGVVVVLVLSSTGCTRRYYRDFADRDVYRIIGDRMTDWRWQLPSRPVEANPQSRIGDVQDPNHVPIPPDDPGARPYQITAGRPLEFVGWSRRGTTPVEDLSWLEYIPRDKDGAIQLDVGTAMRVALMNSREYQTAVENVYLQALQLTSVRFGFFPQLFTSQTTQYRHFGSNANDSNQLQLLTADTLNWTFYSGATLLTNFANSLIFEYNGKGFHFANSGLSVLLTQPLLQGAWSRNFTQPLSAVERQTLYTIRSFAEYRRSFYWATVRDYLNLLYQLQQVRNTEYQVEQLKRQLDENEALVRAGLIDPLSRDNVALTYQNTRVNLLQLQANYQTLLDTFRYADLGIPADFPVKLDESLLKKFELTDPRLDVLKKDNEKLYLSLLQFDRPPDKAQIARNAREVLDDYAQLHDVALQVGRELEAWKKKLDEEKGKVGTGPGPLDQDERESFDRKLALAETLTANYRECHDRLATSTREAEKYVASLENADAVDAWKDLLEKLIVRDFRGRLSEQVFMETQIRVYTIEVNPVEITVSDAISVALANRLDLMNDLAQVTDAWRNVEYGGNQLLASLNVFYNGVLDSAPTDHEELVRFDSHASEHTVGIAFSPPINRRAQRNQYRANQITYQRARRAYMELHDQIVHDIRLDMRTLNLNRRQFEITREAVLIAARQVDQVEESARNSSGATSGAGQSIGLNQSNAQLSLLNNKNQLIQNWIQYEIQRIQLFRDFDVMNIDAQGVWTNDGSIPTYNGGPVPTTPDPVGAPVESLLPAPAPGAASAFARP